jgi:hypothetical protein
MDDAARSPRGASNVVASDVPQTHVVASREALSAEPRRRMGTHRCEQGFSDVLFAYAELRTYPTPCCLHDGCIGLIASLLLAVLSHRLADALLSTDRVTTPGSWPSLEACALGRSLSTSLHRDPILTTQATSDTKLAFRTLARRDPMNNKFLRPTA